MRTLWPEELAALDEVAAALGTDRRWFACEVEFESRWNPRAKNPISSARGLIQFMDTTAYRMGYHFPPGHVLAPGPKQRPWLNASLALVERWPDVPGQLRHPVLDYLKPMAPFPTEQSLYLAVFYPAARDWPPDEHFPHVVQQWNPGIETPADYVAHVRATAGALSI